MFSSTDSDVYSVSSLNKTVASILEQEFSWVWVEGEISNLAQPASGHIYFSLKDATAQVSCAMFKGRNRSLKFLPENGNQVLVRAKVSLYQPRGNYQLIVDRMEEAGDGALRRQFEQLKSKLAAEGLFDEDRKLSVPELPKSIVVITSLTGAAIHDVLSVIERRFPAIPVKLFPVPVQGNEAARAICNAIEKVGENVTTGDLECDVILLVRGGGSLEDLWPFNEETVARAIVDCPVPVVSGVGHEVDTTIADFVADVRTATPTAAAETITPDQNSWLQSYDWYQHRLHQLMQDKVNRLHEQNRWLHHRLQQIHPENRVIQCRENAQALNNRLQRLIDVSLNNNKSQLLAVRGRLRATNPRNRISHNQQVTQQLSIRLLRASEQLLAKKQTHLAHVAATLNAISPLKTLERGYSITCDTNGKTLLTTEQVTQGDVIKTLINNGQIVSRVEKTEMKSTQ